MTACPTPGKRAYRSQGAALHAAIGSSRNYGAGMRVYRCPCGKWHVTKKLPRWSGQRMEDKP